MLEGRGGKPMRSTCLLLSLIYGVVGTTKASDVNPSASSARQHNALFIGNDTAGLLPPNKIVPTATELEKIAEKLTSRLRNQDPFGLATYPTDELKPVIEYLEPRATVKLTLNQALQTLKLNGINLGRQEILIGGRNAYVGDIVEIAYKGQTFHAQVLEVSADQVVFWDVERNEKGVFTHKAVPNLALEPIKGTATQLLDRLIPVEPVPTEK